MDGTVGVVIEELSFGGGPGTTGDLASDVLDWISEVNCFS